MAVFEYMASELDAKDVTGTIVADTPRQARDMLREKGLTVNEIRSADAPRKSVLGIGRSGATQAHVIEFIRELATLLKAGIALLPALQTLGEGQPRRFKAVIQRLADQVEAGVGLAAAMSRQPECFDELCVSVVHVGENMGHLEMALHRLAVYKEKAHRLRSRVTTALMYPGFVCLMGISVSIFLMTYVVPTLLTALTHSGKELPAITRLVKAASDFLINWWWALVLGVAGTVAAVKAFCRTPKGHLLADRLVLRLPLVGELVRKENTSRMAVVMASLLKSGLHFTEAIRITRRTLRNRVFQMALEDYEKAVTAGADVAGPLRASGVFRPVVVQMLSVGQQSGQVEEMLEQLSETYDHEVNTASQRLTALLEPILIVLLAILVGAIAFATILPILEASNVL